MTNIKIKKRYATLVLCLAVGFLSTTAEAHPEEYMEKFPNCSALCQIRCDIDTLTPEVARYCKQIRSKPSVTEDCYKDKEQALNWVELRSMLSNQVKCLTTKNLEAIR